MCVQQDLSSCSLQRHDHNSTKGAGSMLREQHLHRERDADPGGGGALTEMLIAEEDRAPFFIRERRST